MKPKQPTRPLREQIAAYLATVEEATAAEIAKHTTERDYPSRVINELSKMRTDALVETGKKGRELSYWLACAATEPSAPAKIPSHTPEGAEMRRQIIRAAIAGKTPQTGPSVKELAVACGVTGQAVENLLAPMISAGTVGKVRNDGERFHRFFDASTQAIAPPQPEVGHNTGSDGSAVTVPDASTEAVAVQDPAPEPAATRATVAEDEMPPADPVLLAMANRHLSEQLSLYKEVLAHYDINDCPAGLAGHLSRLNESQDELRAGIHQYASWLDTIREHLAPFSGDIDPSDMTEVELAEHAAAAIRDGLDRIFSKSADDGAADKLVSELRADLANARALNDKLQHLLDSKTNECEGLRVNLAAALDTVESVAKDEDAIDVLDAAASYLVRVPKRRPRILTKPQSARDAALAAARNGAGRADVFALVHVGSARRGAEWKEPQ